MIVLGANLLVDFSTKHSSAKGALDAWRNEVASVTCCWRTTHDIKARYPSASLLANNRVIFNIKGNDYRLVVTVRYQGGIVVVEWVGTHAEYDKKSF